MSQSTIKRAHPAYAGRERVKGWHTFQKKFCFMVYCDFERGGGLKMNIFKVLLWWGGRYQQEYFVYALDNVDNSGRPVKHQC